MMVNYMKLCAACALIEISQKCIYPSGLQTLIHPRSPRAAMVAIYGEGQPSIWKLEVAHSTSALGAYSQNVAEVDVAHLRLSNEPLHSLIVFNILTPRLLSPTYSSPGNPKCICMPCCASFKCLLLLHMHAALETFSVCIMY